MSDKSFTQIIRHDTTHQIATVFFRARVRADAKINSEKMKSQEKFEAGDQSESFLKKVSSDHDAEFDEETRFGLWIFQGQWLQKLASKKVFLATHAISGMMYNACWFYYTGSVTTLEKQYKFSTTQISYLGSVYDFIYMIVSLIAPYYCSKGHFPRWMGFGLFCYAVSCLVYVSPYLLYGAGEDALLLTEEYGASFNPNSTLEMIYQTKMKDLCYANSENSA